MAEARRRSAWVVILRFSGEPSTTAQGLADRLDELRVVGHAGAEPRPVGVGAEEQLAAEDLGRLGQVEVAPGTVSVVSRSASTRLIVSATGRPGGPRRARGPPSKTASTRLGGQAGAGRVVDGDELAGGVHDLERPGDRVGPLRAAVDDLDVQEGDVRLGTGSSNSSRSSGRDDDDRLGDVVAVDERLDRPEPDGAAVELGEDLLLLRVAEPRRTPRGREDHGELIPSFGSFPSVRAPTSNVAPVAREVNDAARELTAWAGRPAILFARTVGQEMLVRDGASPWRHAPH